MPIYFCGDVTIDNYEFYGEFDPLSEKRERTRTQNSDWQAPKKIIVRQFGGAYLLARFTGVAWSLLFGANDEARPKMGTLKPWSDFRDRHLNVKLDELYKQPRAFDHNWQISYRLKKCGDEYRVPRAGHEGVTPPQHEASNTIGAKQLGLDTGYPLDLFVVNDRAADARRDESLGKAIAAEADNWTVVKILEPPVNSESAPLLAQLAKHRADRVIAVVPADELRKSGVPISRSLSWERTLRDVIGEIRSGQIFPGSTPTHLVITFDYDAALYLRTASRPSAAKERVVEKGCLVFSIGGAEGEFEGQIEGDMPGAQTAFVSVLAALLYARLKKSDEADEKDSDPLASIDTMLAYGLIAKRRLLQAGFAVNEKNLPFKMAKAKVAKTKREVPRLYYSEGIFSLQTKPPQTNEDPFASPPNPFIRADGEVRQRAFFDPLSFDKAFEINLAAQRLAIFKLEAGQFPEDDDKDWSIFKKVTGGRPHSDYCDYVIKGKTPAGVPICSFGKIKTADVSEIEDFRTVGNLLQSYLSNASAGKPLGIAVFGPPGSGKSFAVKNIADTLPEALKKLTKDDRHECNLTALSDPEDLAHYFQLARNSALRGKIPMLFFDEFDCTVGDSPFFWLKHFLAPLQDGEFRSDQIVHPLGRVIFVFAGGIYKKFADFEKDMKKNSELVRREDANDQPNFKGVDFLSRLHGHIDIAAFSPDAEASRSGGDGRQAIVTEPSYLMRRAFTLRSLLELHLDKIFSQGSPRVARIDRKIVNALLATKTFSHGARSMEAIIRMSVLEGSERFEIAHLPPDNQLKMHLDAENFSYCLEQDMDALWR